MKVVELAAQTLAVAPLSLRSKDGAIPKVGADKLRGLAAYEELPVALLDEGVHFLL